MTYDNNTSLMVAPGLSAEQLGAYIEGNLDEIESAAVEGAIDDYPQAAEIYNDVTTTDINWEASIYDEYPDFDDTFQLPEIDTTDYDAPDSGLTVETGYSHFSDVEDFEPDAIDDDPISDAEPGAIDETEGTLDTFADETDTSSSSDDINDSDEVAF